MSMDSQTRQEELQHQYGWREHVELGPSNKDGTGWTKLNLQRDFEVTYESGTVYRKIVSENGVALDPKEAERKKVHIRRAALALSTITSQTTSKLLGEETIDGHKCWVIRSEPIPDRSPSRWTLWIDEQEKVLIRVQSELLREDVELKAGALRTILYTRNEQGVWLPSRSTNVFTGRQFLAAHSYQTIDFSGYRRFTSDTKIQYDDPN
jgi:hypothetical protein